MLTVVLFINLYRHVPRHATTSVPALIDAEIMRPVCLLLLSPSSSHVALISAGSNSSPQHLRCWYVNLSNDQKAKSGKHRCETEKMGDMFFAHAGCKWVYRYSCAACSIVLLYCLSVVTVNDGSSPE